jgi:hypothetical protein
LLPAGSADVIPHYRDSVFAMQPNGLELSGAAQFHRR